MKIGILTFHCAHNYGAVLQAYALVTYLINKNYDAEIVDYRPKSLTMAHGTIPWRRIFQQNLFRALINLFKIIPFLPKRKKRSDKFNEFINLLPLSWLKYTDSDTEINGYDFIICGSDQVWNSRITNGFDKFFCGSIKHSGKFISYAASTEAKRITPEYFCKYKEVLSNFETISVRETELKNILQPLTNKEIFKVVDPVFLLTADEWKKKAIRPTITKNPYLLVYQVRRDERVLLLANNYAVKHNLEIVEVTAEADLKSSKNRILTASPFEFVGLFAYASCVLTTSFHGTAFSIIFNKPFKTVLFNQPGDGRAMDIMNTFSIDECALGVESENIQCMHNPNSNVKIAIKSSELFLLKSLS